MDLLTNDLNREIKRIKEKIEGSAPMNEEDLKVILLSLLAEEDSNEGR